MFAVAEWMKIKRTKNSALWYACKGLRAGQLDNSAQSKIKKIS